MHLLELNSISRSNLSETKKLKICFLGGKSLAQQTDPDVMYRASMDARGRVFSEIGFLQWEDCRSEEAFGLILSALESS